MFKIFSPMEPTMVTGIDFYVSGNFLCSKIVVVGSKNFPMYVTCLRVSILLSDDETVTHFTSLVTQLTISEPTNTSTSMYAKNS